MESFTMVTGVNGFGLWDLGRIQERKKYEGPYVYNDLRHVSCRVYSQNGEKKKIKDGNEKDTEIVVKALNDFKRIEYRSN